MTPDTTTSRTTPSQVPGQAGHVADPRLGPQRGPHLGRLMRSEWTKLRSLRSTWWSLALAVLFSIGFAAAVAASVGSADLPADAFGSDDVALVVGATGIAAIVLGVLGALQMSSEYASGTISVSLTAVPERWPLLVAKAAVLIAVVGPLSLAVSLGAILIGDAMIDGGLALSWPAVLGNAGYLTAVAVLGLGLAAMARSTAMAIAVLVLVVFVLPPLLPLLPWSWMAAVADRFPGAAQESLVSTVPGTAPLGEVDAAGTLIAWALVPLIAGAILLTRRDA